jgi:hypothetical protein
MNKETTPAVELALAIGGTQRLCCDDGWYDMQQDVQDMEEELRTDYILAPGSTFSLS